MRAEPRHFENLISAADFDGLFFAGTPFPVFDGGERYRIGEFQEPEQVIIVDIRVAPRLDAA